MDYDTIAEEYDAIAFGGYYDYVKEANEVAPHIKPNGCVLEIGAGTGSLLHELQLKGFTVEGLDIAKKMLDRMSLKMPSAPTYLQDCRTFSNSDAYDAILSFGGPLFFERIGDTIVLDDLMNEGIGECVTRIRENLVEGGCLILAVQNEHKTLRFSYRDNVEHQQVIHDVKTGVIRKHYQIIENGQKVFDESTIISRHTNYEELLAARSIDFFENIGVVRW
jgi:cyclopropane fatty-acyl-phospholipid synthase-like methyltransferase